MSSPTHSCRIARPSPWLAVIAGLAFAGLASGSLSGASSAASTGNGLKVRTAEGFEGVRLYLPGAKRPYPCVAVLHGSEGGLAGWSHGTAVMFAAHGFAAMPLNYGRGSNAWHSGDIVDVDLDRTETALRWLRESDATACTKVGLYGASRGAEHALLLASLLAAEDSPDQPDAVAVHAPADTIWGAFYADRIKPDGTYDGRGQYPSRDRAWRWRGRYDQVEPGSRIKIERYRGPRVPQPWRERRGMSVNGTRRMAALLRGANRTPEVHYFAEQGHILDEANKNRFYEKLFAFFERHLAR